MDERQILLDAKELITQQKYEAARRLLRPIAQHPTAEKWLATLDKIAPPPPPERIWADDPTEEDVLGDPFAAPIEMQAAPSETFSRPPTPLFNYDQMTDEEKFVRVKLLLKAKNYAEARVILQTLPDDPAAQKLMEKLDQLRPVSKPPEFSAFDKTAFTPPTYGKPRPSSQPFIKPKPANLPYGKPFNPITMGVAIFTFAPAAMFMLCLNWRRLGKRHWVWPSAAIGFVILLMLIPAVVVMPSDLVYWRAAPITLVLAGFHAYLYAMYYMQNKAYQHYAKYGDVDGMLNHPYDLGKVAFVATAVTVVGVAALVIMSKNNEAPPVTLDTAYLNLEKPGDWHSEPTDGAAYCHDYAQGCFLYLRDNNDSDTGMAFAYFPLNGAAPDAMANALWGQYIVWYPNLPFGPRTAMTVDRIPVIFQEYTFPHRYSYNSGQVYDYYVSRGYVPANGGLVEITFWSADPDRFHDRYGDYEAIIESIDLKNPT